MRMIMTNHVLNDRMERMLYIAEHIGWGEVVGEVVGEDNRRWCMTSTGVVLIKPRNQEVLITAYVATFPEMQCFYNKLGYSRIPSFMANKAMKNKHHVAILAKMY